MLLLLFFLSINHSIIIRGFQILTLGTHVFRSENVNLLLVLGNSGDVSLPVMFWDDGTLSGEGKDEQGDYTISGKFYVFLLPKKGYVT